MASPGEYPSKVLKRRAKGNLEAKRGDVISISMENYPQDMKRCGAEYDRGKMHALFKTLFFDVKWFVDCKAETLKRELIKVSETIGSGTSESSCTPPKKKKKPDCFVCFVSAHGNTDEHGHYITDIWKNKVYIISDILEPFMKCDGLEGIPKVFFINACRGKLRSTDSMVECVKRTGKDSLVFFSTEEGYESFRSPKNGTLFVQALYEAISLNHEKEDVGSMVTIANNMIRRDSEVLFRKEGHKKVLCQVAPSHSNLTGKVYWRTQGLSESQADMDNNVGNGIVGQDAYREKLKKWSMSRKKSGTSGIESQSFGVSGMGGIGKTTLAKSLFEDEEIKEYYDHRVYWVTVKKNPDILKCQRRLISEICKETPSATLDTEKLLLGELTRKLLSERKKILLFLDDVWEKDDVDKMLGDPFLKILPQGSKCIITSRKLAELVKLVTNEQIEKLDVLNAKDANALFCSKAFSRATIPDIFDNDLKTVVKDVIAACGHVPILLTTLGADRWGIRSIESWEEVRDRLKAITAQNKTSDDESATYQKLIEQLMISYDDLPEGDPDSGDGINLKDFFLDFAAFPEQEEIEIAVLMDMWTKPGLTEDGAYRILEELEQRCLVKIAGYWCYVHDIFRNLAVKIIEELPLNKRRRLFAWGMSNSRLPEKWDILQNASSHDCEDESREKLVIFETEKMVITRSELKEFHPRDSILFKCLTRLRMLLLTSNLNLVSLPPEIGCLTSLEKLDLSWCLGLRELPREIGQLESLLKLNMAGCCSLTAIPCEIGKLKKLMELNMQSCGIVKLPEEIGELSSLTWLCLNDCNKLGVLPEAIGKLSSLVRLECDMLKIGEIPKTLGNLSNLKYMSFGACGNITKIPAEFAKLRQLISMSFAASHELKVVPDHLDRLGRKGTGNLTEFNVCNTRVKVEELPPNLLELQKCNKGNSRDSKVEAMVEDDMKLHGWHKRGVLVDTTSVFDPSNKAERRASFGLARIISMVKTEPFLSPRFDTAIRIMYTMANHDGTRHAIVRSGGLPVLLRCIAKGDPQRCGEYAAATLRNICMTYSTHKAVVDAGGLEVLTRVLHRKNNIRFYAYQALVLITNGDVEEGDYAFTSEIYDRCGHYFGEWRKRSICTIQRDVAPCIYCVVEQEYLTVKGSLKS
ncbi:hypothetical protein KC19_5G008800 [Ceratodon purpureus]|uniref:Uncharacterized protein n=1 Tax=Ceratodon purpureus TaxID=3225 RepID=A0A8T0HXA8_CERPU|nr:hypothetical protein KC19_5G008800 [Ceratodon purpureus]